MRKIRINLLPGDGIGPEVVREGVNALRRLAELDGGVAFEFNELPWGCRYYLEHGRMMPDDGLRTLADCDAILLGAVGFPGVPDHVSLRELLLPIRVEFDQYVNLRPVRLLPGLTSPLRNDRIDFTVIRENSEGEYCGEGRFEPDDAGAVQLARFTRRGTERIIRYAFDYAVRHRLNRVLSATKSNALNYSMVFWDRVFAEVSTEFPGVAAEKMHIDALAGYFIMHPDRLQVVVADNLFGDILTDLGSAMLGSIGISPSGNLNPEGRFPSMFEPIHGSAPDIAGRGIANPLGTLWAVVMLLAHLGLDDWSERLMRAIEHALAAGTARTRDIGGSATTAQAAAAVITELERMA